MKIKHNAFLGMSLNVYNKMTNPGFFYSIAKAFMPSDEVSKHLINVPREFLLDAPSLTMSNLTIHLQYYSKINQIKARLHDLINPQEFNPFIETALHALPAKEKIIIHTKGLNELSQILEVPGLDRTDVQTFFLLHEFSHLIDYRNSHKKENDFEKFNHCLAHVGLDDLKNAHEKDAKYQYISLQALRMGQIVKGEMFSDVLAILLYARKKPENAHELLEGILCLRDFEAKFVLNPSDTFYHQDTFELKTHDTKIALEKLKKYFVKNNPDSLSDMSFEKLQQLAENIAYQGVIEHFKKHGKEQLLKDVISVYQMNHTDMQFDLSSIFTNQKKEHVLSAVESLRAQANNREQCLKKFHNVNP